jgi:hypothetical protein
MARQAITSRPRFESIEDIRVVMAHRQFDRITLAEATVLYRVAVGFAGWVFVVGHPDHGSYEWIVCHDTEFDDDTRIVVDHSNQGYGSAALALRDGLNHVVDAA